MAQKYHPDKNPDGKEMFQAVNQAYEILASKKDEVVGPDPVNIRLLIKAQAILFENYRAELEPYKYAGYPMLVATLRQETEDEQLYSRAGLSCFTEPLLDLYNTLLSKILRNFSRSKNLG